MKILILAGSFDPLHKGHLYICDQTAKKYSINKIYLYINKQNPLKKRKSSNIDIKIKLANKMLCKYNKRNYYLFIDKFTYSIDLIKYLLKKFSKKHDIYWLMGADNLVNLHKFKLYQEIIKLLDNIIIFDRKNFFLKSIRSKSYQLSKKYNNITYLKLPKINISSTMIRNKLI